MFSVPDNTWRTHFIEDTTLPDYSSADVQLVTEFYLYRLRIFNKIEVSRLDSTLSVFVIIRTTYFINDIMHKLKKIIVFPLGLEEFVGTKDTHHHHAHKNLFVPFV